MILNCKEIRDKEINRIKSECNLNNCRVVFIQVGDNQASDVYVRNKIRLCDEVGIEVKHIKFDNISEEMLVNFIYTLNSDDSVHGIMVQLPLPKHINENKIINSIIETKDLDGFNYINKGKLVSDNKHGLVPCTPGGIMDILDHIDFNYKGSNVVIVGRSNIVGKPMAQLLINKGATVTVCNSSTKIGYMKELISKSDLFISAIGVANYFNKTFFCDIDLRNIVAIDVGINRNDDGKLCGDISKDLYSDFKYITPVPGGVGIMTVLNVIKNIIKCYENIRDENIK